MRRLCVLLVAAVTGCATAEAPPDAGAGSPPELGSSLNVRVLGDSVRLELHVTNVTGGPVVLEFATTQRYDFEVSRADGERVWRWSDGKAFGEALGREVLEPGESRQYAASWSGGELEGDFVATGRLVSTTYAVELRTGFRVTD